MTIKGRLLSSTAIVKRFQTENILSPPEWQAPLPVRISQPYYVVLENNSGGATNPRKKFE